MKAAEIWVGMGHSGGFGLPTENCFYQVAGVLQQCGDLLRGNLCVCQYKISLTY